MRAPAPGAPRKPQPAAISRRERRRQEIRQRLYRAALGLFAERGFLETTVEAITEAADVGKGTFFNYFPTKEHVLAAYGSERVAAIRRALGKARATKGPVLEVLRELATDAAGQSREHAALVRAIFAAHASCAAVRQELHDRLLAARHALAEIFEIAQQRGEVRQDRTPAELARSTQLAFMGVTMAWSICPAESLRSAASEVWELLSGGLRSAAKPGRAGKA